jgi:predicted lipoprotein with Yx(FWY)xxD motif
MKTRIALLVAAGLALAGSSAFAAKACEELKTEIAAKLDAKKVTGYTLDIVEAGDKAADDKPTAKVVGSCEGGARKIVYTKK